MSVIVISTLNAEFTPPTQSSLSLLAGAVSSVYYSGKMCFHAFSVSSCVHWGAQAPSSAQWSTAETLSQPLQFHTCENYAFSSSCLFLTPFLFFLRLESQLMSDIHTILQLLQRQPTLGPPAYSTVTASPDYQRPAIKVQPVALTASHFFSHTETQVRRF